MIIPEMVLVSPNRRKPLVRAGFSLTEILVVTFLGVLVLGAGILLWTRTGLTVQKGSEMMDLQLALRTIQEQIRNDVRTLTSLKTCQKGQVTFSCRYKSKEIEVSYVFDDKGKRLLRKASGQAESDFRAPGLVESVEFAAHPSVAAVEALELAMELRSGAGVSRGVPASRLAIVSQFSTRSRETPFEIVK